MTVVQSAPQQDAFTAARSRYVQLLAIVTIVAVALGLGGILLADIPLNEKIARFSLTAIFPLFNVGLVVLVRRGRSALAANILVIEFVAASLLASVADFYWVIFTTMLTVTIAATLAHKWLYRLTLFIIALELVALSFLNWQSNNDFNQILPYIIVLLTTMIVASSTRYFTRQTETAIQTARSTNNLLQASADIGQVLSKLLKLSDILPKSIELIQDRFDFYHVQVFLVDETGKNARLAASTGAVGQKLFERQHSLSVGSQSVIGRTTASGQPVIARDTDPYYYRNELLPNTRSELALPIFDGDKIIGALDVQSRRYESFGIEVVQALQVLANQLGTTIRNARLFEEQENTARETRRLFLESETNLREIQRLNQQLTREGWEEYLGARKLVSGITVSGDEVMSDAGWTDSLKEASLNRLPVLEARGGQQIIAVPMLLGSEVIGAIEIETDANTPESEIAETVNAVAQRLALSLDKARLFEESQEATSREQRINEIVSRYQTLNNVDDLLRVTLEELSQSLGASRGVIRLGTTSAVHLNGEVQA